MENGSHLKCVWGGGISIGRSGSSYLHLLVKVNKKKWPITVAAPSKP
jgi:hypothetical protein